MQLKDENTSDTLDRYKVAQKYVSLLSALDDNYVIALDAPWGSGKTTLLELMEEDLEKDNIAYIKYNAWENDYLEDPFLSLISEFNKQVSEKKYLPIIGKLNSLKEVSYQASKRILPSVAKGATQFFIGSEAVKELESGTKEIISSLIDSTTSSVDEIFKGIDESKQSREKFKIKLTEIIDDIITTTKYKKIVFIVDELDRCKPTFAIELLENIKHLFDMKNVIFLISIDKKQLSESIKSVYGSGFDAMGYLKRFFNFDLHLNFNDENYYIESKLESFFGNKSIEYIGGRELVLEAFKILELSLRDYEQILAEIFLLNKMAYIRDAKVYFILLCFKYKRFNIYKDISNNYNTTINNILTNAKNNHGDVYKLYRSIINPTPRNEDTLSKEVVEAINIIESTIE